VHGVGHAIVDIKGIDLKNVLPLCDAFPLGERPYCASGVLMELFEQPGSVGWTPQLLSSDPSWCGDMAEPYKEVCFARAGIRTYTRTLDLSKAMHICQAVPSAYMTDCIIDAGKYVYFAYPQTSESIQNTQKFCKEYIPTQYDVCVGRIEYNSMQ
jgi:hypothetical protein